MAVDHDLIDQVTASIADLYRQVETALITTVAQRLRQDPPLPSPFQEAKLDAVQKLRRSAATILASLQAARSKVIRQAVADAYSHGYGTALADLPEGWFPKSGVGQQARQAIAGQLPNAAVIERLAQALHADVGRVDANILRAPVDAYRAVQAGAAARIATGAYTRREASQAAWQQLVDKGIVNFVDRRGRVWRLSSYVEMIGRTNIARAAVQGQTDRLTSIGLDLVIVSDHGQECSKCRKFEGRVLALSGPTGRVEVEHATKDGVMVTVDVVATLDQARAEGFQHPNAILGDQGCRVLGQIENAARAWYDGPSVHLTTARGHRLTVSPNHPVLTSLGWLAADRIREGMHVFSATDREGVDAASGSVEDLDNVPASFEQVFDALAAHGLRTRVAVAADDFHGDGRHYEGEVDVVWTERALLDVLQPYSVEQLGEGCLVRPGVELQALAGGCSALAPVHGVASPVARSLSDFDAVRLEASSQRRLADAEDPSEVLAGLSCEVALDEVVNVDRDWYRGHAYDLQTSTGAYLTADIVVHNCRHSVSAYQAGITRQPKHTADPQGDKARQKQRALERKIRAAKEQAAAALTPEAKKEAGAKVRAAQAQLRDHLAAHPKLKRLRYREQIGAGNLPGKGGPSGGPVGDLQPPVQPTLDGGPGAQAPVPRGSEKPARAPEVPGQLSLDDARTEMAAEKAARERARAAAEAKAKAQAEQAARAAAAAKKAEEEAAAKAKAEAEAARARAEAEARAAAEKAAAEAKARAEREAEQRARREAVPAPARPYHRTLDGIEDLARRVEQPVKDSRRLGGLSAQTELQTLADGSKVIRKSQRVGMAESQDAAAEHLSSLVARKLGLKAPQVYRRDGSSIFMEYVADGVTAEEAAVGRLAGQFAGVPGSDQGKIMGLLDLLINNVDRNAGNWMLDKAGDLVPIDHGLAFGEFIEPGMEPTFEWVHGDFAAHYKDPDTDRPRSNPLTREDVAEVRRRLEELRPDFAHVGREHWLDYSLRMLDVLAEHAAGDRNLIAGVR